VFWCGFGRWLRTFALGLWITSAAIGDERGAMPVRVEFASGPHFVGQAFEVRVAVAGASQRPQVEPPLIRDAEVWLIGTELKPISASGIGTVVSQSNLFISRFRVLPRRPGTLEIPAIRARIGSVGSGRSQPARVSIQPLLTTGRPAEFLGGVGRFAVRAEAVPNVVRVGQEMEFRVTVTGPAAWGMTDRPELMHYDRLPIGLHIEPKPDETTREPPSRTLVYRMRPTRAGEAVLPPVAIAAFDPGLRRYLTHVTAGVPVRAVAVAAFDPRTLDAADTEGDVGPSTGVVVAAWTLATLLLLAVTAWLAWVRRLWSPRSPHGEAVARRYAARLARSLRSSRWILARLGRTDDSGAVTSVVPHPMGQDAARRVSVALTRYLELGIGRPPGALTPEEARQGVAHCSGSDELGARAAALAARCDGILYRDAPAARLDDPHALIDDARGLFAALGRVKVPAGTETI
jgi:hypothetical protein